MDIHLGTGDDSSQFIVGFGGVVLGAVLSAGVSWWLQREQFAREQRQIDSDKREALEMLAREVCLKVVAMHHFLHRLAEHIAEAHRKFQEHGGELWHYLLPLTGGMPGIDLTIEERSLVFGLGSNEIFNDLLFIQRSYSSTVANLREYNQRRSALAEVMPGIVKDSVATHSLTESELAKVSPRIAMLSGVAEGLISSVEDAKIAKNLLSALSDRLNEKGIAKIGVKFTEEPVNIVTS